MSLVPYPDIASLPEEARTAIEQAPVQLNIFKMLANAETCFLPLSRLGVSILSRQKLDAKLRELVILRVAQIEGGEYEWIQHVPIAISVGARNRRVNPRDRILHDDGAGHRDDADRSRSARWHQSRGRAAPLI